MAVPMSSKSLKLDTASILTKGEQENARIDNDIVELSGVFDAEMKNYIAGKRHNKVVVLLLYWDKIGDSYHDLEGEVQQLHDVFKDNFRYTVYKKSLNTKEFPGRTPKALLSMYISTVVCEVEGPNSLLIVYYAGHGNPGKDGELTQLILTGGNHHNHPGAKVDGIVWGEAEKLIGNNEKSDVFLIFDCCYAGRVRAPESRQSFSTRNFEYIAASNELTRRPGKHSFTAALIYALRTLSVDSDGFTTQILLHTIRQAPFFPPEQVPVLGERLGYSSRRLLLSPLPGPEEASDTLARVEMDNEKIDAKFALCLQLMFDELPTKEDMGVFCRALKAMVQDKQLKATQINWKGMHRSGESMWNMHPSAYFIGKQWIAKTRRTKSSNSIREAMSSRRRVSDAVTVSPDDGKMQASGSCESPRGVKRQCQDDLREGDLAALVARVDEDGPLSASSAVF